MERPRPLLFLLLSLLFLSPSPLRGDGEWGPAAAGGPWQGLREVYDARTSAVVRVLGFFHREDGSVGTRMGSGFFIRGDGCVVTAAGAVEGAHEVLVEWDGGSHGAEILGADPLTNLAVLRPLEPPETPVPFFSLGEDSPLPPPPFRSWPSPASAAWSRVPASASAAATTSATAPTASPPPTCAPRCPPTPVPPVRRSLTCPAILSVS